MIGPVRLARAARLAEQGAPFAALAAGLLLAAAGPAAADHPLGDVRPEGLSPLALALVTGGLAVAAALLVVVIVMLLTRRSPPSERAGE